MESDLGVEQETRVRREGEILEPEPLDPDIDLDELERSDPEFAEDLRRAETNPPQEVRQVEDPYSDIDQGYLEDEDARDETETIPGPVALEATDPFEIEREERDRPGRSEGPMPGQADTREES